MNNINFEKILIIGVGLIGSSIAHAIKKYNISEKVYGIDTNIDHINKCIDLKILLRGSKNIDDFSDNFDLIIMCSPLGTYKNIFSKLNSYVKKNTLLTDVGSTKMSAIKSFKEINKNNFIKFIPSHPIAGLEKSGPEFGFAKLFANRFCIITPFNINENSKDAIEEIVNFWNRIGMQVQSMDAQHHDRVLAMTSHIPQLIAYSIVATATELESHLKDEVIKYSAAGFRDFTRLAEATLLCGVIFIH